MASYAVATGELAVHDKALVASTVDTVTFADDPEWVEVVSDGTAKIYVRVDGNDPIVSGAFSYVVPAVPCARRIRHWRGGGVVKLISSGTPTYSITSV